ncbi:MAG: recombinase family protein [Bdellovibrionales bacterium]
MATSPLKVVTYSRVSTSHHTQNPQVQVEELRRYCKARDWEIVHEVIDHGYCGDTVARPGLKHLQELVKQRQVDAVIVVKLDRLFRSLRHLVVTLEEWESVGVKFVAVKDSVDWTTPAGRFFVQVLGSLAELEKSILIERTMMGLEHARRSGKKLGRPKTRNDSDIQRLRAKGLSYTQIQKQLGVSRGSVFRALNAVPKTPAQGARKSPVNSGATGG